MKILPVTETPEGELRCLDLDLAERLGYKRRDKIREPIKRHRATLAEFGPLSQTRAMVVIGSGAKRRVTQYHLNREQAIYLTTQAAPEYTV